MLTPAQKMLVHHINNYKTDKYIGKVEDLHCDDQWNKIYTQGSMCTIHK